MSYEVEADRAAGDGDRMTIDFVGSVDGEEFEGGKGDDVQLVVGQGNFIPGFVEGLRAPRPARTATSRSSSPRNIRRSRWPARMPNSR